MTPDSAPITTLAAVGHPANGVVARKESDGEWYYLTSGAILDFDTKHKALSVLWSPIPVSISTFPADPEEDEGQA